LAKLFNLLPKSILPSTETEAIDLLGAMHTGIVKKDEPRANLAAAFHAYLQAALIIGSPLPEDSQRKLIGLLVVPIIPQYLRPTLEQSEWSIPGPNGPKIIGKALVSGVIPSILKVEWPKYAETLIEDIKTSAPEQSKDFDKSHKALIQQATRFATLQAQIVENDPSGLYLPVLSSASASIVSGALEVLKNRNGKPFGAAGVVAEILRLCGSLVFDNISTKDRLIAFVHDDLPGIFMSLSCSQLAEVLYACKDQAAFEESWKATLGAALGSPESTTKAEALTQLLTSPKMPAGFTLASSNPELQKYINQKAHDALDGSSDWSFFAKLLQTSCPAIATETTDEILSNMTKSLSIDGYTSNALEGLQKVSELNPTLLRNFVPTPEGSELLHNLLFLVESPNEQVAQEASAVNNGIHAIINHDSDSSSSKQSIFDVIQNGLKEASPTSVSVNTLVELATKLWAAENSKALLADVANHLLPDGDAWKAALAPFLDVTPRSCLSITNNLGGTCYLVPPTSSQEVFSKTFPRDGDGLSPAFRIASYAARILWESSVFEHISTERKEEIYRLIALTVQLSEDNLGLAGCNNIWAQYTPEIENLVILSLDEARAFLDKQLKANSSWWDDNNNDSACFLKSVLHHMHVDSEGTSSAAYYSARALSTLTAELVEVYGWNSKRTPDLQVSIRGLRTSKSKSAVWT
jgi:hypothetical protein